MSNNVTRIDEIIPGLWLGGDDHCNKHKIKKMGFTAVVCIGSVKGSHAKISKRYVNVFALRFPDHETHHITKKEINDVVDFIHKNLNKAGVVLVHCHKGISRSATFVIAYLIKYEGYTDEAAIDLVHARHPNTNPNQGFREQLDDWNNKLFVMEYGGDDKDGNGRRDTHHHNFRDRGELSSSDSSSSDSSSYSSSNSS